MVQFNISSTDIKMNIEILQAMVLVTSAFGAVVARDIPPGPDLEVDDFMIAEEENVMEYWNYTAKLNTHTVRSNGLENIQCDFDGQYMEHPTCCYKFVQCSWLTPIEKTCDPGTAWSQPKLTCDHDRNTNCGPRPPKDNKIAHVSFPPLDSCSCGMAKTNNRIIDGVTVSPEQKYPWQVGLRSVSGTGNMAVPGIIFCGGSIINNKYVLTAAHCFYDNPNRPCVYVPTPNLHVHIGEDDQYSTKEDNVGNNKLIPVNRKQIYIHPCFNCLTGQNDFALLELNDIIVYDDVIKPVCLPEDDSKTYKDEMATVAGWGLTDLKNKYSSSAKLLEVDVTILDNNNCGNYAKGRITPNMLCAGNRKTGGENTCKGDSGGALIVKEPNNGKYVQVGVVSFAEGCALKDFATVFGRVSKVLDWIKTKSASGQYCTT